MFGVFSYENNRFIRFNDVVKSTPDTPLCYAVLAFTEQEAAEASIPSIQRLLDFQRQYRPGLKADRFEVRSIG